MKNEHKKILWNTIGSTVNALSSLDYSNKNKWDK